MTDARDVVTISPTKTRIFSLRLYKDTNYGYRYLGPRRFSLDFWRLGFVFENYR